MGTDARGSDGRFCLLQSKRGFIVIIHDASSLTSQSANGQVRRRDKGKGFNLRYMPRVCLADLPLSKNSLSS